MVPVQFCCSAFTASVPSSNHRELYRGSCVFCEFAKRSMSCGPSSLLIVVKIDWFRDQLLGSLMRLRRSASKFWTPGMCCAVMVALMSLVRALIRRVTIVSASDLPPSLLSWHTVAMLSDFTNMVLFWTSWGSALRSVRSARRTAVSSFSVIRWSRPKTSCRRTARRGHALAVIRCVGRHGNIWVWSR